MLLITFFFGIDFLAVKYIEYSHKFHENLVWGTAFYALPEGAARCSSRIATGSGFEIHQP